MTSRDSAAADDLGLDARLGGMIKRPVTGLEDDAARALLKASILEGGPLGLRLLMPACGCTPRSMLPAT